ncbi:MAG: TRAP transporter small permease, partial [Betaproteobacteria bacterium]
ATCPAARFIAMKAQYSQAMEWLYLSCVVLSWTALVASTLIIPLGVFMRYIMNNPMSWPEPAAVVMMVMFSFIGGAAVYRANVHVAVEALLNAAAPAVRRVMLWGVDACMGLTALFMLGYGAHLCVVTRYQTMAEFPGLSVAFVYMPIPVAGLLTLLFLIERLWLGAAPKDSIMHSDALTELE